MTLDRFVFIANIVTYLSGIGFLATLYRFVKRTPQIRILCVYFFCDLGYELFVGVLYKESISPNYAATVYLLFTFPLIALLYYLSFKRRYGILLLASVICFEVFGLINVLFIQRDAINSYTYICMSLIVIIYALYYFFLLMKEMPTLQLHRSPMFWINSAFTIYFSGNLFLFVFTDYLVEVLDNNLIVYWTFHNGLSIIEILLLIVAAIMDLINIRETGKIGRSSLL